MRGFEVKKKIWNSMMDFSKISIFVISRQNGHFWEKMATFKVKNDCKKMAATLLGHIQMVFESCKELWLAYLRETQKLSAAVKLYNRPGVLLWVRPSPSRDSPLLPRLLLHPRCGSPPAHQRQRSELDLTTTTQLEHQHSVFTSCNLTTYNSFWTVDHF